MRSNWIAVSKNLLAKREILSVSRQTGRSRYEVAGILIAFWSWIDEECENGDAPQMDAASLIDLFEGTDALFWNKIAEAGWLLFNADGMKVPNFERWFGEGTKRRLKEAARKFNSRVISGRKMSANMRTKCAPEQNRTELFGEESPNPSCPEPPAAHGQPSAQNLTEMAMDGQGECARDLHAPESGRFAEAAAVSMPETPPVLIFPTVGPAKEWHLTGRLIAELEALFPATDVLGECRRALAWVLAAPAHRKTAKGMRRFLTGWLSRANDRGRNSYGARNDLGRASRIEPPAGKYAGVGREIGAVPAAAAPGT